MANKKDKNVASLAEALRELINEGREVEVRQANDEHYERVMRARGEDRAHYDKVQMEAAAREDARLRKSMLHRLYTAALINYMSERGITKPDLHDATFALRTAREAQAFFDAEAVEGRLGIPAESGKEG